MENNRFSEYLQDFGLTRQEAVVYQKLLAKGKQTGYEIAKETGISRSNVYGALTALTEKGAAYVLEETAKRYVAVSPEEFCDNQIRKLQEKEDYLVMNLPKESKEEEGYITIEGREHILDKARHLISGAKERVYISCTAEYLNIFKKELLALTAQKKKVVIITDGETALQDAVIYRSTEKGRQLGIITDSRYVLTGEFGGEGRNTCLYSGQPNFVELYKTALANEIKLIELVQ